MNRYSELCTVLFLRLFNSKSGFKIVISMLVFPSFIDLIFTFYLSIYRTKIPVYMYSYASFHVYLLLSLSCKVYFTCIANYNC